MTTRSIIDLLQKVLALTTSPNENEALAASAHLARLLSLHNLDIADLESRGAQAKPGIAEGDHDLGKAAYRWKLRLADIIADFYYCVSLTDHTAKRVRFAGRPDNVESLRMIYRWLVDQICRIANDARKEQGHADRGPDHIDPLRWQVHFGEGAVSRLGERLEERRQRESDQAGTALAIHHGAEVSDYLEEKYGFRRDGRPTKRDREWNARWEAGKAARRAEEARVDALRTTDPEAYYAERPWERPLTPEQEKAAERKRKAEEAKERRNEARRKGRAPRHLSQKEWKAREQGDIAKTAGRKGGDRLNLDPFITDGAKTEARRIA